MAATIDELQIEIQASATKASSAIDMLAASLARLRTGVKGGSGLTTTTNQLKRFTEAINQMSAPSAKVAALVAALKPLETIGKSNLGSALNQLKKIPEITAGLDDAKLSEFAAKIVQVTDAIRPLAAEMEKVSAGFSRLPANIQRAINANARLTSSNYRASSSFFKLSAIMAKVYVAKRIASVIGVWIKESNDYVENLNLFTVAMGEYADSAKKYAEQVQEAVGIDASEFMRYQGVFMNMARGFGVASDKAALMSKNLTQLGYDLASLYNVKFDIAMEKLESGLSGQPRPMREWGFDLSEATLKAKALELGIKKNVELMSQAEKSQIRYVQLMETAQKIGATGDFARTLNTSANQLRILQSSATLAARALGNIFIPALNAILPYAIAFLKVIRWVAQEIANLFGFTLPKIDYSGLDGFASGADDAADAMDNAAGSAKKLKGMLAGFDEINVITQPNVGGGGGGGGGGDLGIKLPDNSGWLDGAIGGKVGEIFNRWKKDLEPILKWIVDNFDTIKTLALTIGALILGWKIAKGLSDFISALTGLSKAGKITLSLVTLGAGVSLAVDTINAIWDGKLNAGSAEAAIRSGIASLLTGLGSAGLISTVFAGVGFGPALLITLPVAIVLTATAVSLSDEEGQAAFGNLGKLFEGLKSGKAFQEIFPELEFGSVPGGQWYDWAVALAPNIAALVNMFKFFGDESGKAYFKGIAEGATAGELITILMERFDPATVWIVNNVIKPIVGFFEGLWKNVSGFFSNLWGDIKGIWNIVSTWFNNSVVKPVVGFFEGLWEDVSGFFTGLWDSIEGVWDAVSGWFNTNVITPVTNFFKGIWTNVSGFFSQLWVDIKGVWTTVSGWFDTNVIKPVTGFFEGIWTDVSGFFTQLWTDITGVFTSLGTWFKTKVTDPIGNFFKGMINKVIDFLNTLIRGLNKIKINLPQWGILGDLAGKSYGINIGLIPRLASGGFPIPGELFIARESGPEMVGTMGGRTAVANNDQIVEGVAQGVARAMSSVMSGQSTGDIYVYIGNDQLESYIVRANQSRLVRSNGVV